VSIVAHEIRPYDPERDQAYVVGSWIHGLCEPGKHACRSSRPILDLLARPDTTCVIAHHPFESDQLYGWCCVSAGALAWVYVRRLYGTLRGRGLGTTLMLAAGTPLPDPTPCLYWSPYATILAAKGYRLYYAPIDERTAA
jgi:hypothetical protein